MPIFRLERLEVTSDVREKIVALRHAEFTAKFADSVDVAGLSWNVADSKSEHFGAWADGEIVSTLRMTFVDQEKSFEEILLFPANHVFAQIPCAILARAATVRKFSGHHLGTALRVLAYETWLASSAGEYIFGTALAGTRRFDFLSELGYEFLKNPQPWRGYLKPDDSQVEVFRLSRATLTSKIVGLRAKFLTGAQFEIVG